ncbi:hypothetical protein JCM8547_007916 [Rhodosporidiobolus lusitaniae]
MFSVSLRAATRTTCASCRTFASLPARAFPAPSSPSSAPANSAQPQQPRARTATDNLLDVVQSLEQQEPSLQELSENPSTILRHLSRNQAISPQHLSPHNLLVPFPQRPNFSKAFPLGPPVSYGPTHDPFVRYGIDPLDPVKGAMNPLVAGEYVTTMGKIMPRGKTQLQRKTQRKLGKAVRRARSMGILPTFGKSAPTSSY